MFKNRYQGGPFVEVFSATGKNPIAEWKIFGSPAAVWKEYDKEVKGFVFVLEGSSQINKMQLPKESRQILGLIQQFLTLQIFVPLGQDFSTELLISDIGKSKRRLYLSTVHKKLSVTPLHARIPLFTIKRNIWCNMCIDLVSFTSELFRGAVFQSLDGIIISANCKLRKIFTLRSKPQDIAKEDDMCVVPAMQRTATDFIPQTCQLNTDVPQITQLLNLADIRKEEIKYRKYPITVQETDVLFYHLWKREFMDNLEELTKRKTAITCSPETLTGWHFLYMEGIIKTCRLGNTGQGRIHSTKTQSVSHIAFGSRILGPPPSSNRRVSRRLAEEVTKTRVMQSNVLGQLQSSGKGMESVQDIERLELSFLPCNDSINQGDKRSAHRTTKDLFHNDPAVQTRKTTQSGRADFQLASPQGPSADRHSHRRLSLKNAAESTRDITSDEWVFPESFTVGIHLDRSEQLVAAEDSACSNLTSPQNVSVEHHSNETSDNQVNNKEIFTFSSRPQSAPQGKSPNMSPESCIFPLDLKQDSNGVHGKTQTEDKFHATDSSEENDNNEFIQGAENSEINHSKQETSDSTIFKDVPLKMSWRNEYCKNKGYSEHNPEETIFPKSENSTVRRADSVSSQRSLKAPLSLSPTGSKSEFFKVIPDGTEKTEIPEGVSTQLKKCISKKPLKKMSREDSCVTTQACEYDWKNYQSNSLSSSELQMLASMKRQQNEELRYTGISHGLSASQVDDCNVSISTSSDDTATWNSCFPPPISQEHHYQKEMSPLSHSNPRDWLDVFSPPIIPGHQQVEEHAKSSTNQSIPGEDDLSAEADEEILTLLYDPCLNCYFDPSSGKYYELA